MVIGVYARKSVFSDKSDSIEAQIKTCTEYAQSNYKIETIIEYKDEGFTGANTNRPGFEQLMKDVLNKRIDILICYKIDRISRNVLDFSTTFNKLQENRVEFVSVKEQIDTSTPLGRAMMYICSVFAQMERETIAERVKDSMIELAKSGKWTGGKAPLGYKGKKVQINGKFHTMLVENEGEVPFLNMIYDTFLKVYSLSKLETYFKNNGIRTLNGNFFFSTQLYNILKNPHYVAATNEIYDYFESLGCIMASEREKFDGTHGLIVYGRNKGGKKKKHTATTPDNWIVSVGLHKPLISSDKWLKVQARFGQNILDKTRKYEIGILKGIAKCKCGYSLRVKHKVDKTYNKVYNSYYCLNRYRKGLKICDMKMVSTDELDEKVISTLKQLSLDKNLIKKYMKDSNINIPIKSKDVINKEISSTKKKIENLTTTLQDNTESSAVKYLIAEIEKLDKQVIGLNYELREIERQEQENYNKINDVNTVYTKILHYLNSFDELTYDEKVRYLREIIKECIWDGRELSICI